MTKEEARAIMIEQELDQARNTISFMHGCLTREDHSYAYPEQTIKHLENIDALLGPTEHYCVHSIHKPDCESCQRHIEWMSLRHEAREVLGIS